MTTPYSHENSVELRRLLDNCISMPYVPLAAWHGSSAQYFVDVAKCPSVEVGVGTFPRHTRPLAMGITIPLMELIQDNQLHARGVGGSDWHIDSSVYIDHVIVEIAGQVVAVPTRGQLGAAIRHNRDLMHVVGQPVPCQMDIATAKAAVMLPSETGISLVMVPIEMRMIATFDKEASTLRVDCEYARVTGPISDPVKRVKVTITDVNVIGFTLDATINTTNRERYGTVWKPASPPPDVCYDLADWVPIKQVKVYASSDPEKATAILEELQRYGGLFKVENNQAIRSSFTLEYDRSPSDRRAVDDAGVWLTQEHEVHQLIDSLLGLMRISESATLTLPLPTSPKFGVYNLSREIMSAEFNSSYDFTLTTRGVHYLW